MSKFSKRPSNVLAPVKTVGDSGATYEGGVGYARDEKSELFLLAVTNMVSEGTFYEKAGDRDERFRTLIRKVAQTDPSWIVRFVPFLRDKMNMRSASVVMAAEFVKVALETSNPSKAPLRQVISSALLRADEPGEMLAYWQSNYGRNLPQPVKRGVADATVRLYNERAALKYDGVGGVWRMADVIERVHPEPKADWQRLLFKYLIDKRHNREDASVEGLGMLERAKMLDGIEVGERRAFLDEGAELFEQAGFTWERLSGWLQGPMDSKAWEAIIPSMGYMALLRNLRNFDEAGVSDQVKSAVVAKLSDPEQVARSRQLPLRFYSAWHNAKGLSWGGALESALNMSIDNVPSLAGKTLVLVDVSGSMNSMFSNRGKAQNWELAALFGAALALRGEKADLFAYDTESHRIPLHKGDSVLRTIDAVRPHVGGGTDTLGVLGRRIADQKPDRVVILTDEQAWGGYRFGFRSNESDQALAASFAGPVYTFNLAGYQRGHLPSGEKNRYTFGGLSDHGFAAIELLEKGQSQEWPF
jgi:hypothetical protein